MSGVVIMGDGEWIPRVARARGTASKRQSLYTRGGNGGQLQNSIVGELERTTEDYRLSSLKILARLDEWLRNTQRRLGSAGDIAQGVAMAG
jgi:hypothetical protein